MSTIGKSNRKILNDVEQTLCVNAITIRDGGGAVAIKAGDPVFLLYGKPSPVDCRVLTEGDYEALVDMRDRLMKLTVIMEGGYGS